MKVKNVLLLFALLFLQLTAIYSQSLQVSGRITSKNNTQPLVGATVGVKGTNIATATDNNGQYTLLVPSPNSVLVVTYLGMQVEERPVNNQPVQDFNMNEATSNLGEVVVVGYGVQRKSLVTGAISSIKSEQISSVTNTRIEQAMQGRVAGVQIVPTSGQPGAGLNIRIRGTGSNRNSSPLFIIDGVRAGGIESLDPSEVASIEILKDAASAAIYGAEGANGVVIITTKTGKRNSSEISYQSQVGVQSVKDDFIKMMNAQQYQQYLAEANVAGRPTPAEAARVGEGTNWLREVLQTAPQHHHSLTFSGGSERSTYLINGNLFSQEGIVGGDKSRFQRYTFRVNTDNKIKSWLNVGNRFVYSHHRRRAISDNNEFGSILSSALVMDPTTPVIYQQGATLPMHVQNAIAAGKPLRVDANGNIYGISNYLRGEYGNPLARIDMARGENVQNKIVGNAFVDIEPFSGFKFTSRFSIDAAFQTGHGWTPTFWFSDESQNTIANGYDYSNNWFTWQLENFANYQRKFGSHNVNLLAGVSAQKTREYHIGGSYSGLFKEEDKFSYADFVPDLNDRIGSIGFNRTLASFYGRVNYDYNNKYLFAATLRRDGSSLFAPGYQWGTFPSVSAGWVFSNENFFPASFSRTMNYGKLRASWGQNGSLSSVGLGEWMNSIGAGLIYPDNGGNLLVGAAPTSLAYPQLTWETSEQVDIGADFAFFNNRLTLTMDYYKKTTKDLLTAGNAPMFAGNFLRTVNAGTVENTGFEFELAYNNRPNGNLFNYEVGLNFSTLKNRVTYLDPNSPILFGAGIGTGWSATAMQVGEPIWYFNGYKTQGIFQTQAEVNNYLNKTGITGYNPKPGEPIVVDVNGDKQISPADMTNIGSPHPDFLFGGRVNLSYKGFDLLVFVQGQVGNEILMGFNRTDRSTANKPYFFYANRWTGPGSTNTWFAANTSNPYIYNSDLMIFDGSFARIRQLQLGYTLPRNVLNRIRTKNARLYVTLDDWFTFTRYPGVDPEGGSNGGNSIGIDRGGYPIPRRAMAGISITF
ncbi:SusC/RagA family TonB-linked outer membrane protein [Aridibaculum aurantiacum]|uniref:SusC/RagA family TonB-linked outer membrane protein n=1 Tax=Aridibaculum aurantiacum TaxID=2810307 RepID=UPI001A971DD5|nr:TonB-dependent receptor [Aridibaculum aurantiacum]